MASLCDHSAILADLRRSIFAAKTIPRVSDWADAHAYHLVDRVRVKWSTNRVPYLRGIMDAASCPSIRQITLMKFAQGGGTEAIRRVLGWSIDAAPARWMLVYPSYTVGVQQVREEFIPTAQQTPRLSAHIASTRALKNGYLQFDTCSVLVRGAGSEANLEGFNANVICDELDRCPPGTADIVRQRSKTRSDGLVIFLGTPGIADEGIHAEFLHGDMREWHVPCPRCGEYHTRRLSMVRWPGLNEAGALVDDSRDLNVSPDEIAESAWMKCPKCKGRIEGRQNVAQQRHGVWLPAGWKVDVAGGGAQVNNAAGDAVCGVTSGFIESEHPHASFMLHGLFAVMPDGVNPYGAIASRLAARGGVVDANFVTRDLGEPWRTSGVAVDPKAIAARVDTGEDGFAFGTVPAWSVALTAGVDVQADRAYVEVLAHAAHGERVGVVWFGHVPLVTGGGFEAVVAKLRQTWPRADGGSSNISRAFIDTGHRAQAIYALCREHQAMLVPCKGLGSERMDVPVRPSRLDRFPDGTAIPGGLVIVHVNTWNMKDRIFDDLACEDRDRYWLWLPRDCPPDFARHLTSEHRVLKRRRNGTWSKQWTLRPGRTDNHYLDTHVYAIACAEYYMIRSIGPRVAPGTPEAPVVVRRDAQPRPMAPMSPPMQRPSRFIPDQRTRRKTY